MVKNKQAFSEESIVMIVSEQTYFFRVYQSQRAPSINKPKQATAKNEMSKTKNSL